VRMETRNGEKCQTYEICSTGNVFILGHSCGFRDVHTSVTRSSNPTQPSVQTTAPTHPHTISLRSAPLQGRVDTCLACTTSSAWFLSEMVIWRACWSIPKYNMVGLSISRKRSSRSTEYGKPLCYRKMTSFMNIKGCVAIQPPFAPIVRMMPTFPLVAGRRRNAMNQAMHLTPEVPGYGNVSLARES
jgi:hypothetical protein